MDDCAHGLKKADKCFLCSTEKLRAMAHKDGDLNREIGRFVANLSREMSHWMSMSTLLSRDRYEAQHECSLLKDRVSRLKKSTAMAMALLDSFLSDDSIDGDDGDVINAFSILSDALDEDGV